MAVGGGSDCSVRAGRTLYLKTPAKPSAVLNIVRTNCSKKGLQARGH